jgi:hypothetical protein
MFEGFERTEIDTGGPIECGRYVQEQAPDETYERLIEFFR